MPKGFSEFHYYGFLTKCAEHGLVDPKVVDAMYKLAARPPRMVRDAYTGERLGYENAPLRPIKDEPVPAAATASATSETETVPTAPEPKPAPVASPIAKPVVKPKAKPVAEDSYKPRGNVFNLVQHGFDNYDDGSIFNL